MIGCMEMDFYTEKGREREKRNGFWKAKGKKGDEEKDGGGGGGGGGGSSVRKKRS